MKNNFDNLKGKPWWIVIIIFGLSLYSALDMWKCYEYERTWYGYERVDSVSAEGDTVWSGYMQVPIFYLKDTTDLKYYRLAAMGDTDAPTPPVEPWNGVPWFSYPKWTRFFWYPLTFVSQEWALILNHVILSLCVAWMALKLIPLRGGWIIAIFGSMAAKYSLEYGNVYPVLCALSMTRFGSLIPLLMKPYMAVFPLYRFWKNKYMVIFIIVATIATFFLMGENIMGIVASQKGDFFVHNRQWILVLPLYYYVEKYLPERWFT